MTSQFKSLNRTVRFKFEEDQPLSDEQVILAERVLEFFKTPSNKPKTIQLIAQPQSGKTNTVINIIAKIHQSVTNNECLHLGDKNSGECNLYYFQPSDNQLKGQVIDRFKDLRYDDVRSGRERKFPELRGGTIKKGTEVITPTNISGIEAELSEDISACRAAGDTMIFIHDESHHSLGNLQVCDSEELKSNKKELAKLTNFFRDNQIMLGSDHDSINLVHSNTNLTEVNPNYSNEIYINISASPADVMKYMKTCDEKNETPFVQCYYLKPHVKYLSFKEIAAQKRFKQCFEIFNKSEDNISRFMISVVCQNLLLSKPGCLIVRLKKADVLDRIRDRLRTYNSNPEILNSDLTEFLDPVFNTPDNIEMIKENLKKLSVENFECGASSGLLDDLKNIEKKYPLKSDKIIKKMKTENERQNARIQNSINQSKIAEEEKPLFKKYQGKNVPIATMDFFMKDEAYQQGEYRILCITNSFLQGKTFNSLDNVRGWFDRDRDEESNNAFTIQSIGRNCGPYLYKNYTYPIWTNINEIDRMINLYEILEDVQNTDSQGRVKTEVFNHPAMRMTSTNVRPFTKTEQRKYYLNNHMNRTVSTDQWEADFFSSKSDAEIWITQQLLKQYPDNVHDPVSFDENAHGISVAKNNANNVMEHMTTGALGHYRKTGKKYGLIHLDNYNDHANPDERTKRIDVWNNTINNKNSIFYNKQGWYIAFIERNSQEQEKYNALMNKEKQTKSTSGWQFGNIDGIDNETIIEQFGNIDAIDNETIIEKIAILTQKIEDLETDLNHLKIEDPTNKIIKEFEKRFNQISAELNLLKNNK